MYWVGETSCSEKRSEFNSLPQDITLCHAIHGNGLYEGVQNDAHMCLRNTALKMRFAVESFYHSFHTTHEALTQIAKLYFFFCLFSRSFYLKSPTGFISDALSLRTRLFVRPTTEKSIYFINTQEKKALHDTFKLRIAI